MFQVEIPRVNMAVVPAEAIGDLADGLLQRLEDEGIDAGYVEMITLVVEMFTNLTTYHAVVEMEPIASKAAHDALVPRAELARAYGIDVNVERCECGEEYCKGWALA